MFWRQCLSASCAGTTPRGLSNRVALPRDRDCCRAPWRRRTASAFRGASAATAAWTSLAAAVRRSAPHPVLLLPLRRMLRYPLMLLPLCPLPPPPLSLRPVLPRVASDAAAGRASCRPALPVPPRRCSLPPRCRPRPRRARRWWRVSPVAVSAARLRGQGRAASSGSQRVSEAVRRRRSLRCHRPRRRRQATALQCCPCRCLPRRAPRWCVVPRAAVPLPPSCGPHASVAHALRCCSAGTSSRCFQTPRLTRPMCRHRRYTRAAPSPLHARAASRARTCDYACQRRPWTSP